LQAYSLVALLEIFFCGLLGMKAYCIIVRLFPARILAGGRKIPSAIDPQTSADSPQDPSSWMISGMTAPFNVVEPVWSTRISTPNNGLTASDLAGFLRRGVHDDQQVDVASGQDCQLRTSRTE
jgi:hypothetical protein